MKTMKKKEVPMWTAPYTLRFEFSGGRININNLNPRDDVIVARGPLNHSSTDHILFTDVIRKTEDKYQGLKTRYLHGHVRQGDYITIRVKRERYKQVPHFFGPLNPGDSNLLVTANDENRTSEVVEL